MGPLNLSGIIHLFIQEREDALAAALIEMKGL